MRLNDLFSDNMVFQANKPIRIFGTGGGNVVAEICGNRVEELKVGVDWQIELPPMPCGGPYELAVSLEGKKQILHNIYIGEVYILGGQSNMQFKLRMSDYNMELCKSDSMLRLFSTERVERGESFFPQDGWVMADRVNVADWSCLGYLVGKELREKKGCAVGLITCYQGAAKIQCFLPKKAFENSALNIPLEECYDNQYPWNRVNSLLYDFQVKKIAPFSAAGVIWYQGESNASEKEDDVYEKMLSALIYYWREAFEDENLPFTVIQLADYIYANKEAWRKIQQSQYEIQFKERNVKTVICRDICESNDIHPKQKSELAKRIAGSI